MESIRHLYDFPFKRNWVFHTDSHFFFQCSIDVFVFKIGKFWTLLEIIGSFLTSYLLTLQLLLDVATDTEALFIVNLVFHRQ